MRKWLPRFRRQSEEEFVAEVDAHLAHETDEQIERGLPPEDARYVALRRFGNVTRHLERFREASPWFWLETVFQDLRYAARGLRRTPWFTATAIVSLALGIGLNTATFTAIEAELLRPLPYKEPARIVRIDQTFDTAADGVCPGVFDQWQQRATSFESLGVYDWFHDAVLRDGAFAERVDVTRMSSGVLAVLGVPPLVGRTLRPEDDRPGVRVALLAHDFWMRRWNGDRGVLGTDLLIDDDSYRVVGIMPAGFRFYHPAWPTQRTWRPVSVGSMGVYRSIGPAGGVAGCNWQAQRRRHGREGGERSSDPGRDHRLRGSAECGLGHAEARGHSRTVAGDETGRALPVSLGLGDRGGRLAVGSHQHGKPVDRAGWRPSSGTGRPRRNRGLPRPPCATVAHGERAAVADGRHRRVDHGHLGRDSDRDVHGHPSDGAPARSESQLARAGLYDHGRPAHGRNLWRGPGAARIANRSTDHAAAVRALDRHEGRPENARGPAGDATRAVARAACWGGPYGDDVVTPVGQTPGLQRRQPDHVRRAPAVRCALYHRPRSAPGAHGEPVAGGQFPRGQAVGADGPVISVATAPGGDRLRTIPGVSAATVTVAGGIPMVGAGRGDFALPGRPTPTQEQRQRMRAIIVPTLPGYFATFGMHVLAGRDLSAGDQRGSRRVAVINQHMARTYWPHESQALGDRILIEPPGFEEGRAGRLPFEVVGIVNDVHFFMWDGEPASKIYTLGGDGAPEYTRLEAWLALQPGVAVRVTPGQEVPVEAMRRAVAEVTDGALIERLLSMTALRMEASNNTPRLTLLLSSAATIALLLAAIGVFGMVSYTVTLRTREIGIRVALGATRRATMRLVLSGAAWLALAGIGLGFVASFWLTRLLGEELLPGTRTTNPGILATGACLIAAVVLIATWLPARRAAAVAPVVALREE